MKGTFVCGLQKLSETAAPEADIAEPDNPVGQKGVADNLKSLKYFHLKKNQF
jgi:hypothetical protein